MRIASTDIRYFLQRSCALTQGFVLDCRDSQGGSKEFYIAEFASVASTTIASGVATAMTKLTGKQFYKYSQVKQTASVDEAMDGNEENGTIFFTQTVNLVLNKRQVSVRNEILLLAKNLVVIVEVDRNGNAWIYGLTNGLMLQTGSKATSGKAMGDRNGYELQFKGFEPELAHSVQASVVTALTTPGT